MTQPELNGVIEHLIVHPREGDEARYALITAILGAMLILPSGTDVSSDPAALRPVVIDHEGTPHVVVFNSVDAARTMRELAPFGLTMRGDDIIRRVARSHGLLVVVDGGMPGLPPAMLDAIRADLTSGRA